MKPFREKSRLTKPIFYFTVLPIVGILKILVFTKADISSVQIEQINPIRDFNGWGKRTNQKSEIAYLTTGTDTIHIVDSTGRSIYLSVIDIDAAKLALRKFGFVR